jgi:hypothetical protein
MVISYGRYVKHGNLSIVLFLAKDMKKAQWRLGQY